MMTTIVDTVLIVFVMIMFGIVVANIYDDWFNGGKRI